MSIVTTPANEATITLASVKALPIDQVYDLALKHLLIVEKQRLRSRRYSQIKRVRVKRKRHYYAKNDIYHPEHNPEGTLEKHCKRPAKGRAFSSPAALSCSGPQVDQKTSACAVEPRQTLLPAYLLGAGHCPSDN
jgi:hypothetical protein